MRVQFMNLERFKSFIKSHADMTEHDMNYYINSLILTAYRGKSSFKLWNDDTTKNKAATIHFECDHQVNEEKDEEYLAIKFLKH